MPTDTPPAQGRDPIAYFLRFVLDNLNDVSPETILDPNADQDAREKINNFARGLYNRDLIEPTITGGELLRVRVTDEGRDYLARRGT